VAVVGTRGLPASYGGVERHVEEICSRLVARGHDITVFCRRGYVDEPTESYRGLRLVHLPTVSTKSLDALVHSALASVATVGRGYDLVAYHAVGPGLMAPIPRYVGRTPVVQTIHGLDADRAKWGKAGRVALTAGAWLSGHLPDATIVVSEALVRHYRDRYDRHVERIPNGVDAVAAPRPGELLRRWGLRPGHYVLFVGRLVPEKAPDRLLRAFLRAAPTDMKLVLAGGSSFTDSYVKGLNVLANGDQRIVMPGFVYGEDLHELYAHAALFVLPSDVEGLPLTLLEAASFGVPVLVSDIEPHIEILVADGPGRRLVPAADESALAAALDRILGHGRATLEGEKAGAVQFKQEVLGRFSWERAAQDTEAVYLRVSRPQGSSGQQQ
jgi:glycosyltransferase involved in cell wall biosynthesis